MSFSVYPSNPSIKTKHNILDIAHKIKIYLDNCCDIILVRRKHNDLYIIYLPVKYEVLRPRIYRAEQNFASDFIIFIVYQMYLMAVIAI